MNTDITHSLRPVARRYMMAYLAGLDAELGIFPPPLI